MENMSNYLPEEILHEILKRLPSKSLCRFLSVSKPWFKLITTQSFISSNLTQNQNTETNTHLLFRIFPNQDSDNLGEEYFLFHHQTNNGSISKSPSFIIKSPVKWTPTDIIGSCNGLVCFKSNSDVILWNPSIHKFVKLPRFSLPFSRGGWYVLGFGVNLLSGDFKVIGINMDSLVEVYSLKTGLWRRILGVPYKFDYLARFQLHLNGRCHWISKVVGNEFSSIISFDVGDEMFREVPIPEELAKMITDNKNMAGLVMVTLRETEYLGVVIYNNSRCWNESILSTSIWVMKEYGDLESWAKLYFIDDMELRRQGVVGFMKNGNILMCGKREKLTCYDPVSKLVSNVDIFGSQLHFDKYVESLVLLEPRFHM